jgi:hypothetical protein
MPGRSHFNLFNKDTRELFMLCILLLVPVIYSLSLLIICLFVLVIRYCRSLIFSLFDFHSRCCSISLFFNSCVSLLFVRCSKDKSSILILNCVQVFWSCIQHHLYESINIIQQTPLTLSWYRSEGPITTIDIAG